ncbi:MAG: hypothetical protein DWI57_15230, partial [Chloroflexi bacterium]
MTATTIAQVLNNFNPRMPLSGQNLRLWFVPRASSPRRRLEIQLRQQRQPLKILLVGHRGSGKTTELNKLAGEMTEHFETVGFDVLNITGRSTLGYEDLMLSLSTQVTRYAIEKGLIGRPLSDPLQEGWQRLSDWWRQVVAGLEIGRRSGEVETFASLNTLLGEIEIGVTQSAFTRDQINQQLDRQMPELVRHLNWVIDEANRHLHPRRLLLIVEGLDKVDLAAARSVFRDHAPTITSLNAAMIYTFPLALRYSEDYLTVLRHFHQDYYLHNLALRHADGSDDAEGVQTLRQIVRQRLRESLIAADALEQIVFASGGIPLDLVKLVSGAALYALERDEAAEAIVLSDAQNAIKDLRRELAANLSMAEWQLLRQRHTDRRLSNETAIQQLLYKGALIEYSNDIQWCDVHPAL